MKPASDPEGRTIGIVGMGGIGSVVAKRCIAFDMKVLYYNRNPITPTPSFPCEYVSSLSELLKRSDVVSLNLPLNKNTEKSFGKEQFDQMKDGACLVNTARGGVVDQEALIDALKSGKVSLVSRIQFYSSFARLVVKAGGIFKLILRFQPTIFPSSSHQQV